MARFEVRGQVQPAQGTPVTKENTKHSAFRDMPRSRGAAFADVPAPTRNVRRTPRMSVRNVPADVPTIDVAPVPPSAVYSQPPGRVTGTPQRQPSVP
jgi:hypothetical protein